MTDTATQPDAIQLLTTDHAEVEQMVRMIESLPATEAPEEQVQSIIRELSVHAAIEEQVLYPAMRKALPDGETLVQEAIDEHQQVKEILAEIERTEAPAERRQLLATVMANVRHHVEEEENEMFPKLRDQWDSGLLDELGERMQERAKELEQQKA